MLIYKITNKINGKSYIGQTTRNVKLRVCEHKCKKTLIGEAMLKYGENNFCIEYLDACLTLEELNEREVYWIQKLDTIQPKGYNKAIGTSKFGENNGFFGKNHKPKTIEMNMKNQPTRRALRCIETGEIFISIRDCARKTGYSRTKIKNSCKGKIRKGEGMSFEFVNEEKGEIAC